MSFFGFLGGLLKGGLSVATHGLVHLGGGGNPSTSASLPVLTGGMGFSGGGPGFGMPSFSPGGGFTRASGPGNPPGGGSSLLPHFACAVHQHHKKPHTKAERNAWFAAKCVTNRHMRVTNPKALRRAIRRLYGAEKMYARLLRVTHPHKLAHGGRVHPKPPRRRKA